MRSVWVDVDGLPTERLVEVNQDRVRDDRQALKNGTTGDGHGISEEGESRTNEEVNDGRIDLVRTQTVLHAQHQQQPQGPIVRWESFLPVRSLKVLLVENDDSTRHVVSALLRNCSYEVTAVSNGVEAWKILEDLTNHIDLVLTEVAMPCLSGIGLLSKIMNHKTCKNIPVIMMSSNDSMGIVFKCLSKGAVDFLVKPIRKNELKNLWQHVWRKCHSSSGSGSVSGIRTKKSTKSKSVEGSDNNTDSNDEDDNGSIGLNYRDRSDNGSGTQNSWPKRVVEVDSPQPMSSWDDLADPPDSTCAQVIHSRPEAHGSNLVPTNAMRKSQTQDDDPDNFAMGKDLRIGVLRDPDLQLKDQSDEVQGNMASTEKGTYSAPDMKKDGEKLEKGMVEYNNEMEKGEIEDKDNDLMGAITNITIAHGGSARNEVPNDPSKTTVLKDMDLYHIKELPSLELSLKRLRDVGNDGNSTLERKIVRHSDHSAFSRYNTIATANQATTGNVGSCSPVNNSSEAAKTESMHNLQSNSSGTPNQGSNGSSNNNDMGSTINTVFTKVEAFSQKSTPRSAVSIHPCSAFQSVQNGHNTSLLPMTAGKPDCAKTTVAQGRATHQHAQVEHHHYHHYHHHHHHVHSLQQQQQQQQLNGDDLSLRNMISGSPQCGTSNMLSVAIEGNAANYDSASGSNNGSNVQNGSSGQNGCSTAVIVEETNVVSDKGATGKCGAGGGIVSGSRSAVDQNRLAQREAALNKFRQKRKERNFDKKVRYQSRQKLAELRPRVRGQFVRQTVDENKSKDKNKDTDS